jgi:hypothetical protein
MKPIIGKISPQQADHIEEIFINDPIPLVWVEKTVPELDLYCPAFVHSVYEKKDNLEHKSPIFPLVDDLVKKHIFPNYKNLKFGKYQRIRYFVQPDVQIPIDYKHDPYHIDLEEKNITIVYYINNSGGGTIINTKNVLYDVKHIKGNYVIFDGSIEHAGKISQNFTSRAVLNINILI